jgi:hypothetical protein
MDANLLAYSADIDIGAELAYIGIGADIDTLTAHVTRPAWP